MGKKLIGFVDPITPESEIERMRMVLKENEKDDDGMIIVSVNNTKVSKITIEFKE